jgi:anaerobic dimethyl sulfoxide reductase subunit B (iron-sulfur subunit)
MNQLAFYFDANCCSGCKTCHIACKDKNDLPLGVLWRRVYEVTGGDWIHDGKIWRQNIFAYNVSMSCNHCKEPVCLKNCPATAITKRPDGIVEINSEKCLGCKYCQWVCPYGAPQFNSEKGIMTKCNLCADYVDEGKNPSCVDACPMRALDFGDYDELVKKYGDSDDIFPLPDRHHTEPSMLVNPHRNSQNADSKMIPEISNFEETKLQ